MIIDKETREQVKQRYEQAAEKDPTLLAFSAVDSDMAGLDLLGVLYAEGEPVTPEQALYALALAHNHSSKLREKAPKAHSRMVTIATIAKLTSLLKEGDAELTAALSELLDADKLTKAAEVAMSITRPPGEESEQRP